MNFFKRLWYILQGKTNEVLDRMEDPEQQLSVFVNELNEQVQSLHRSVASALADEKRLQMQIEDYLAKGNEWEARATLALQEGHEDLAREALVKKEECETQSLALQKGWDTQKAATEKLKASLQAAKLRVSEAKTKYTLLLAQYKSAATKKKLHESLSTVSDDSPMQLMERLSDKIRTIEAETEANLELGDGSVGSDLEAKFIELERRRKGDQALDLLKAKIAAGAPLGLAAAGSSRVDELKAKLAKA